MRPALLLSLILLSGCAGYHLGPTGGAKAGARSVQVNFFQNKTPEPRLVTSLNAALRQHLVQDGTFKLDTHEQGDLVINGEITQFKRSGVSFLPGDVVTARDYNLILTAQIKVTERGTGKVVLDRLITGRTTIRVGNDLPSAERQAVPLLADDLARNATALLVDGTW